MIKFINMGVGLKTVHFKDGSGCFLKRGESITTNKAVSRVDEGIKTIVPKKKAATKSSENQES